MHEFRRRGTNEVTCSTDMVTGPSSSCPKAKEALGSLVTREPGTAILQPCGRVSPPDRLPLGALLLV